MRENDIARKCTATLIGVALIVCSSVLASWWIASSGTGVNSSASQVAPESLVESAPSQSKALPLAFRPVSSEKPLSSSTGVKALDDLERQTFQLEMENARLRGRLDDMLNWILDNVRGTYPLSEGQMANLRITPVDEDMAVSGDLAEVLRLNKEEITSMDTAFIGMRAVLQEIEAENIQVEEPLDNQVVLSIPPYGEDGELVREELYRELEKTLGPARFDRFLEVAEIGLEEQFEYFGEVDRTLQFEALEDDGSGIQLFVRDERVLPSKDDPFRQDILASERIVNELPSEYYPYWDWLPEYVTQFSQSQ